MCAIVMKKLKSLSHGTRCTFFISFIVQRQVCSGAMSTVFSETHPQLKQTFSELLMMHWSYLSSFLLFIYIFSPTNFSDTHIMESSYVTHTAACKIVWSLLLPWCSFCMLLVTVKKATLYEACLRRFLLPLGWMSHIYSTNCPLHLCST